MAVKKSKSKARPKKGKESGTGKRDVLFAPWRHTYIKRAHLESEACVFCVALEAGVSPDTLVVYTGKTCSVILNKFPYNNGHVMVIPHRHTADFDKLSDKEFTELHELLQQTFKVLKEAYAPQGMNIGMNLGRVGGAGIVDHLHYHLVPRWNGDTNFMPVVGQTKVISESLEETYNKLLPLFR